MQQPDSAPSIAVFGPNPLLTITVEALPSGGDEIHLHAGGQGVWVARTAGELGSHPVLCGFLGGEVGTVLEPLLQALPGHLRLCAASRRTAAWWSTAGTASGAPSRVA